MRRESDLLLDLDLLLTDHRGLARPTFSIFSRLTLPNRRLLLLSNITHACLRGVARRSRPSRAANATRRAFPIFARASPGSRARRYLVSHSGEQRVYVHNANDTVTGLGLFLWFLLFLPLIASRSCSHSRASVGRKLSSSGNACR